MADHTGTPLGPNAADGTEPGRDNPAFLGRGWRFPPNFDAASGDAMMVEAGDDIIESLRILFETRPGERIMHPTYGCRLHDLVFEPMSGETEAAIEVAISRAILFHEPRITLDAVEVAIWDDPATGQLDAREGRLMIRVEFTIIETNSRANVVFPFYGNEGTLVSDEPIAVE